MFDELGLRDDAAAVVQEVREHAQLVSGELDRLPGESDPRGSRVERQRAVAQFGRELAARAPDQGAQPRQQLLHPERLGEVVVGAAVDAADLLAPAAAGGEHQHRQRDPAGAPALEQRQPVDLRQPEVEDRRVVGLGADEQVGALSIPGGVDRVPAFAERGRQAVGQ